MEANLQIHIINNTIQLTLKFNLKKNKSYWNVYNRNN